MSYFVSFCGKYQTVIQISFKGQESQSGAADGTKVNGDTIETKASESRTMTSGPRWWSANDLYDICSERNRLLSEKN